jgi:hypothetical protein
MLTPMSTVDFLMLQNAVRGVRVLDVDGPLYRLLVERIEQFEHLDLCWLSSQRIDFISRIAQRVIADRYPSSIHVAV